MLEQEEGKRIRLVTFARVIAELNQGVSVESVVLSQTRTFPLRLKTRISEETLDARIRSLYRRLERLRERLEVRASGTLPRNDVFSEKTIERLIDEIGFAKEQGFVGVEPFEPGPVLAKTIPADAKVFVVKDPVKRPDDNLFLHLDTEEMLWTWDGRSEKVEMGELNFRYNGQQSPVVVSRTEDGQTFVYIREALANSLRESVILSPLPAGRQASAYGLRMTEPLHAHIQTVAASAKYAVEQSAKLAPSAVTESQYLLVSSQLIEKNYGIVRSIGALSSMGYKIFVYEGAKALTDAQRQAFYQSYHLDHLLNQAIVPVHGNGAELAQQMTHEARRRLDAADVVSISFKGEEQDSAIFGGFNQLMLADDVLGFEPTKRADYPVLLLAAKLKEQPAAEALKKLGLGAEFLQQLSREGGRTTWFLQQTPPSLEFSEFLIREFQNYQAIAQQLASAA